MTKSQIAVLKKASKFVENDQGTSGSFKHAMREAGQSIEDASEKMEGFISEKKSEFISKHGNEALFALGEALHPIMDSTSPAHEGFQVWEGFGSRTKVWAAIKHALKEKRTSEEKFLETVEKVKQLYEDFTKAKKEKGKGGGGKNKEE